MCKKLSLLDYSTSQIKVGFCLCLFWFMPTKEYFAILGNKKMRINFFFRTIDGLKDTKSFPFYCTPICILWLTRRFERFIYCWMYYFSVARPTFLQFKSFEIRRWAKVGLFRTSLRRILKLLTVQGQVEVIHTQKVYEESDDWSLHIDERRSNYLSFPDGKLHNLRASKTVDRCFWITWNFPMDGFWGSLWRNGPRQNIWHFLSRKKRWSTIILHFGHVDDSGIARCFVG